MGGGQSGGASSAGGGSGGAGSGGISGGAGSGGQASSPCPEAPLSTTTGALLELSTELTLGDEPIVFGEPNPIDGGATLLPLELRFYVSEAALVRADGTTVNVDIVTEVGTSVPYGIHLVNADDPASLRFRLLGPPGTYSGVSFLLGINDACNSGSLARNEPLSAASGMTWPPPFGYLFLRYAGTATPADASSPPSAIHMGGLPGYLLAPRVQARGDVVIAPNSPASRRLVFDFGELFRGAATMLDLSDFPGSPEPEVEAGERVRRTAPELSLFTLSP
jgi:hypothetical protein